MLKFCTGDVFAHPNPKAILAHGVNCCGVMGAGIALEMAKRFPKMKAFYKRLCADSEDDLIAGCLWYGETDSKSGAARTIANLFTQRRPGPDADPAAIALSVREMLDASRGLNEDILMPLVGSGIGGLNPDVCRQAVEMAYRSANVDDIDLWVVERFVKDVDPMSTVDLNTGNRK